MLNSFIDISQLDSSSIKKIITNEVADNPTIQNKNIGCLYEKPSTRTRVSFAVGIKQLGANFIDLKFDELNFARNESLEDTFKALSCYLDGLIYRTTSHQKIILASTFFNKPVINALSEKSHPCQVIADLITLYERFNKIDLNICWFGDLNNVLYSLVEAVNLIEEIKLNIFSSSTLIKNNEWKLSNNIFFYDKLDKDVIRNADCIMTDVYISMNDNNSDSKVKELQQFQVNRELMSFTNDHCVFMHCLPAKIGYEVTNDVINSKKSIIWKQAYNRLPAQVRIMKCINW